MTLEEFLDCVIATGFDPKTARLVIEDEYGDWVFVHLVDVEEGSDPFIRFFRDDDIPSSLGAPGSGMPAGSLENAATPEQAEVHATMRCRNPWHYDCRMSRPGSQFWRSVEIDRFDEEDGYDVVVLKDAGEALNLLW